MSDNKMKTVKLLIPTFLVFCSIYCLAQGKEGVLSTEGISPSVSKRSRLAGVKHEERYPGPDYIIYANG